MLIAQIGHMESLLAQHYEILREKQNSFSAVQMLSNSVRQDIQNLDRRPFFLENKSQSKVHAEFLTLLNRRAFRSLIGAAQKLYEFWVGAKNRSSVIELLNLADL